MGDIVMFSRCGRDYARAYVKPANPDTDGQRIVRKTFGDAVRSWQGLSPEDKRKYNKQALRLNKSGYNLYISRYMKENISSHRPAGNNMFIPSRDAADKEYLRNNPVTSPYVSRGVLGMPVIRDNYTPVTG